MTNEGIFSLLNDALAVEDDIVHRRFLQAAIDLLKMLIDAGVPIPQNIQDDVKQLVADVAVDKLSAVLGDVVKLVKDAGFAVPVKAAV